MAAVTINAGPVVSVAGSKRDYFYNISGNSGDTLTIGFTNVLFVGVEPNTVTGYSVAAGTIPGTSIITFTTGGGAFTGTDVEVLGN